MLHLLYISVCEVSNRFGLFILRASQYVRIYYSQCRSQAVLVPATRSRAVKHGAVPLLGMYRYPFTPYPHAVLVTPLAGTYTCKQQLDWGQCPQPWMKLNGWCLASCGLCSSTGGWGGGSSSPGCVDVVPPGERDA